MLPAVAVVDAVRAASDGAFQPGIKWVNDILLAGRKVSGVLTATKCEGDRMDLAVLGVGLNVERTPDVEPTPFVPAVGCLRELPGGGTVTLPRAFRAVMEALEERYEALVSGGPEALFRAYRESSVVIGRPVRVWEEGAAEDAPPFAEGVVRDIRPDLSLVLEGRPDPVSKGRLALTSV
jgi:BirA family biotin operon repressor/biotin-[acetyl-CoA-carboxylase] ligase